jgi:hypothetical protein
MEDPLLISAKLWNIGGIGFMRFPLLLLLLLISGNVVAEQTCDTSEFPLSTPTERFIDNGDGTVTDKVSGLMWMRCALGQEWSGGGCTGTAQGFAWSAAGDAAAAVNEGGAYFFSDWRVPGLRDLAMIAERECQDPRINLTVFPNTAPAFFWTSTPRGEGDDGVEAYALSFGPEGVKPRPKQAAHLLRLVRTAQ